MYTKVNLILNLHGTEVKKSCFFPRFISPNPVPEPAREIISREALKWWFAYAYWFFWLRYLFFRDNFFIIISNLWLCAFHQDTLIPLECQWSSRRASDEEWAGKWNNDDAKASSLVFHSEWYDRCTLEKELRTAFPVFLSTFCHHSYLICASDSPKNILLFDFLFLSIHSLTVLYFSGFDCTLKILVLKVG